MSRVEELVSASQYGNKEALAELLTENSGLIWSVARRFTGRGTELEDLYQLGCVGFIKAVQGFDLAYGTQFSTYAVPKISGEIRRFLRDDGAVKVSRSIKENAITVKNARCRLENELGRDPTVLEISNLTGLSPEEIATAELATQSVESIQSPSSDDGFTLESVLSDTESEEKIIEYMALNQAIEKLDEKEKLVIQLRFFHGLTQQQTARIIKVSQVQISRIEKRALTSLRALLS